MISLFRRSFRLVPAVFVVVLLFVLPASAYSDEPPVNPPFYGGVYITGSTRELGSVTVYIPVNYQSGYLGLTSSGNLCNVSSSSISGVIYRGSSVYDFRLSSWSEPQYRVRATSYYQYEDLTFTSITASNAEILDSFPPLVSAASVLSLVPLIFLGVIVLCLFMKRF